MRGNSPLDKLPTTYAECARFLSFPLKRSRSCGNNTTVVARWSGGLDPAFGIVLHSTEVVSFYADGEIDFHTGGWHTVTTKDRLNRVAKAHGYSIGAKNGKWFITDYTYGRRIECPFVDPDTLTEAFIAARNVSWDASYFSPTRGAWVVS